MKRLSIIAVAAIAALLSASCNKSIETPVVPVPQGSIILDLNISGFDGAGDTKAAKADWPPETSSTCGSTTGTIPRRPTTRPRILSLPMTGRSGLPANSPPDEVLGQAASSLSCMKAPITCPNIRLPSFRFRSSSGRIKNRMLAETFISCL